MGQTLSGCAPFWGGGRELDPHLTQCGLGWGLPPCPGSSWSIEPFGHNRPTLLTDRQDNGAIAYSENGHPKITAYYKLNKVTWSHRPCVLTKLNRKPQATLGSVFGESGSAASWAVNSFASLSIPPVSYTSHRAPSENITVHCFLLNGTFNTYRSCQETSYEDQQSYN